MSTLTSKYLNGQKLLEDLRLNLVKILDSILGTKILILDQSLSGPLSLITKFSFLKSRGVEKVYFLQDKLPELESEIEVSSVLYLVRPSLANVDIVANHINKLSQLANKVEVHLYLVPRRSLIVDRVLETKGVLGAIDKIDEFPLDLIPIEDDLFSLQVETCFSDLYQLGDLSTLFSISQVLMKFQNQLGFFNRILGKGNLAKQLDSTLSRLRLEQEVNSGASSIQPSSTLHTLVILDRTCDLITPLITPLTYTGLLDDQLGIKNFTVEVDRDSNNKTSKFNLNGDDKLYLQIRDSNFAQVGEVLSREARLLETNLNRHKNTDSIKELRQFVAQLGDLQNEQSSLKLHVRLGELITQATQGEPFNSKLEVEQGLISDPPRKVIAIDYVLDRIARQDDLVQTFKLICLQSQIYFGIPSTVYQTYTKEICQTYGYHHILTFQHLEKVGLLKIKEDASTLQFDNLRKGFQLLVDEVNELDPNDISYVFSGYAPLSIRLVQCGVLTDPLAKFDTPNQTSALAKLNGLVNVFTTNSNLNGTHSGMNGSGSALGPGWSRFEDLLNLVPGPTFDYVPKFNSSPSKPDQSDTTFLSEPINAPLPTTNASKIVVVVMLGGITFAEISALRYLSSTDPANRKFIVVTTNLISGSSMLKELIEISNLNF